MLGALVYNTALTGGAAGVAGMTYAEFVASITAKAVDGSYSFNGSSLNTFTAAAGLWRDRHGLTRAASAQALH